MKFLTTNGLTELIAKIKADLSGKVSTSDVVTATAIDIDSAPASASTNLITSGGVYTALSGKADNPTIKTTMDSVAVVNTHYYLGEQTAVSVTLPSTASVGQSIAVIFYSGSTAATLSVSGTTIGTVPTPAVNQRIDLLLSYDGTNWAIKSNVIATA